MAKNLITIGIDNLNNIDIKTNIDLFNAKNMWQTKIDLSKSLLNSYISIKGLSPSLFKKEIKQANTSCRPVIVNITDMFLSGLIYNQTDFSYHSFGNYNNKIPAYHEMGFQYFIIFPENFEFKEASISKDFFKYTFSKYIYYNTLKYQLRNDVITFIPYQETFLIDCIMNCKTNPYTWSINKKSSISYCSSFIETDGNVMFKIKDGFATIS